MNDTAKAFVYQVGFCFTAGVIFTCAIKAEMAIKRHIVKKQFEKAVKSAQ